MSKKQFSMMQYWNEMAQNMTPELSFCGESREDWENWRKKALTKYIELLGDFPKAAPLDAEIEYSVEEGDLIRQRVVFDVEENMSVPCYVLYPKNMKKDHSNAAILCAHGHGQFGKDVVAGMRITEAHKSQIDRINYNYAEIMAKAGYITIAPDLRGFGERKDPYDPVDDPVRDPCNVQFMKGALMGVYTMTLNICDLMRCVDYLITRDEVNPERIGMMGLSTGGTYTAFTAAVDPRIKAADVIGYLNPFQNYAVENGNFCGAQFTPSLYKYLDSHDIAGLIAPRALMLEMGIYDYSFPIQDLLKGYDAVKKIYDAAGCPEKLWADIHAGGHAFAVNRVFDFFAQNL